MKNATTNAVSTPATNNAEFVIDTKITADGKVTVALNGKKMSLKKAIADLVEADAQIVKIRNEQGETLNYLFNDPFGLNRANLYFYWSFKTNFVDRIARGELDPKTGEPKSLTADREIERQREAKREAERAELDAEWAKYEHARHYAAKIALDSKSVNDNFRYCIYCAPQQPVQTALAESRDDDTDVFSLIPEADELNDIDQLTAETVNSETETVNLDGATEINNETVKFFNGKFYSVFSRKYHGAIVKTNGIISYCVFNDGDTEVYDMREHEVSYDEFMHIMTERAEHLPDEPQPLTDDKPKAAEVKAETASSMVIEVKTFDSGRFTVKLNGKKIALKVLEQAPYYDSADLDAVIIFNGRKFRNVGDIKVVTDYYNVFADENGYGFFVSGISGDIWNLGKGMTSIRDMSNEIAQIEAKRKASEEMWNAIKVDPLNATPKIEIAIGADATPAMIDIFEPHKFTLNTPAQILKLIEDTAGSPFSFDFESYFIKDDGGNKRKFITRHFVSECGGYGFIEIITEDGKLDHVEFVKHMFAQYKTVEFRLAAPAKVATDTNNKTAEAKAEVASNPHELIIGDEKITFESGHSGNVSSAKYGASFTYVGNRRGYFRVKFDGEDDSRIVTEHEFFKVMVNRGACKIEADTAEAKAEAENINTNHKEATQMANDNTEVRVTLSVKDYFDADKDAELLDELEHDIKWIDGIIRYRVDAAQGVFVTFSEPSTDAQVTALFNRYGLNYSRYVFREVKHETEPPTADEMNAAIDRLVAEFDREQTEADRERKIAEAVADSMTAEAPHGWAVTFTDAGNYEVTAHGLSTATVDTITAGDYLNPKEFFAKFLHTQADIDDEREETLRRLEDEREQLLHMRDELIAEHPDEVERLMILDEMIADTDADIAAFESMVKLKPDKPIEFDKKGNVKNLWF